MGFEAFGANVIEAGNVSFPASIAYQTYVKNHNEYFREIIYDGAYNVTIASIVNHAPILMPYKLEIIQEDIIETLRLDFLNYLVAEDICINPNQINIIAGNILQNFNGYDGLFQFRDGFYYIIPIDNANIVNNQPAPKYLNNLSFPLAAYTFPANNINHGNYLVKTLTPFAGNLPVDVAVISSDDVKNILQAQVNTIFAL